MLLVFSRLSISRPLLTNLLSFPLGPNHTFNSLCPSGFGVFSWARSKPLTAAGPPPPISKLQEIPGVSVWSGCSPGKSLTSFSHDSGNFGSYSILWTGPAILLIAKRGFLFFLNLKFHQKTPQLSFSRALKVRVPWLMKHPWTGPHHVPHQRRPPGLQTPVNFWDVISSRDTQPHLLRGAGHLRFIFHRTSSFLAVPNYIPHIRQSPKIKHNKTTVFSETTNVI